MRHEPAIFTWSTMSTQSDLIGQPNMAPLSRRRVGRSSSRQREVKCDFFRIAEKDKESFVFSECAQSIMQISDAKERNLPHQGDILRMLRFEKIDGRDHFGGIIARLRPDAQADICPIDSDLVTELSLEERKCLTDLMHFIYVPELDIVVAERTKSVSGHMMCDYLRGMLGDLGVLECEFFADSSSLEKFRRMNVVTKVGVRLVYDRNAMDFNDTDLPLNAILNLADGFGAHEFLMEFSVGHKKVALSRQIKELVNTALGWEGKIRPKAIIVRGSDETATSYLLNLTRRKFDVVETVQWEDSSVRATRYWHVLFSAYRKVKDQLKDLRNGAL